MLAGSSDTSLNQTRLGYADFGGGESVTGWAFDLLAPDTPVILRAVIDGQPAGEVACTLPRDDMRAAGVTAEFGGFRYDIPADFIDGQSHCLRLELPGGAPLRFPTRDGGDRSEHVFTLSPSEWLADSAELQRLLQHHGITSRAFLPLFDVSDYVALNSDQAFANAAQCVRHFARTGRERLCPVALDWRFDPAFYAETVREAAALAPPDAYLHWLNTGIAAECSPNPSAFLRRLGLQRVQALPAGFRPALYSAGVPALAGAAATPWGALRHLIETGIPEDLSCCPEVDGCAELYLAAADRLAAAGRTAEARRVYEKLLGTEPRNAAALQHYADCLLRLGDVYAAEQAYLRVKAAGGATIWTDLNLARCRSQAGRLDAAAEGLAALAARHPGDRAIEAEARAAAQAGFEAASGRAHALASAGLFEPAREAMRQAATRLIAPVLERTPPGTAPPRRAIRAVALVADCVLPQCRFYRAEQKLEQLRRLGITAHLFDAAGDLQPFGSVLPFVDAVIFYRVAALPGIVAAIEAARLAGLPTVYEIDDLIFDPEHFPDSFASYGGLLSREAYGGLVTGTALFQAAMSLCDHGIASTAALAERMRPHVRSGTVWVHRNALGEAHLRRLRPPVATAGSRVVRIFYGSGTLAGNEDFELHAAPALARLLHKHGGAVELVVMGHLSLPPCLSPHAARIRRLEPVWDIDVYWSVLAQMDVNIAVLKSGAMSDCKSEIKWLEAAMFAIPSVLSPTATHRAAVTDGVDALLAASPEEWFAALDRLVRSPRLRARIGAAAQARATAQYGPEPAAACLGGILAAVAPPPAVPARRRRVLVVNVFFPPQAIGGATRVVADNVAALLRDHGDAIELEVFTTTEGGGTPYELRRYQWNGVGVTAVTAGAIDRPDWTAEDPRMGEVFDRVLAQIQPDLVHFHCIQRLTASICSATARRGIPYVVTVHDGWWISDRQFLLDDTQRDCRYDFADPVRQLAAGGAASLHRMQTLAGHLAAARAVLAVSEPFAALHRQCGLDAATVLENGVSAFAVQPRQPSPDGRVRLAHVGGAAPHKGYNLLKAALMRVAFRTLSLTVVDHAMLPGSETTDLWGSTPVRSVGRLPQADIGQLYAAVDVLVAPSLWPESYGLVAREALHAGCWVIASDRGAIGSDVTPECGFVVDVSGVDGLIGALAAIDRAPARYRRSPAARVALRASDAQASELASLYLRLAGDPDPAPPARPRCTPARARKTPQSPISRSRSATIAAGSANSMLVRKPSLFSPTTLEPGA